MVPMIEPEYYHRMPRNVRLSSVEELQLQPCLFQRAFLLLPSIMEEINSLFPWLLVFRLVTAESCRRLQRVEHVKIPNLDRWFESADGAVTPVKIGFASRWVSVRFM